MGQRPKYTVEDLYAMEDVELSTTDPAVLGAAVVYEGMLPMYSGSGWDAYASSSEGYQAIALAALSLELGVQQGLFAALVEIADTPHRKRRYRTFTRALVRRRAGIIRDVLYRHVRAMQES